MRIGLLEDDHVWQREVEDIVAAAGHSSLSFSTMAALQTALQRESFDLLLLDWNVPDGTGLAVLRWAQEHLTPCPPVIMITSRSDPDDIVGALQAGADDYAIKPCQPGVLAARIEALLRRSYPAESASAKRLTLCGADFYRDSNTVSLNDQTISLTAKEFELALILFRNVGRPMSRAHLLKEIWNQNLDAQTRTLDVHISKIRNRLGLRPEHGFRLLPVHSFGYRLEIILPGTA